MALFVNHLRIIQLRIPNSNYFISKIIAISDTIHWRTVLLSPKQHTLYSNYAKATSCALESIESTSVMVIA